MSFSDHELKRIRKYDGTHVNMASYNTDSNMAETTISRHVGELEPLTTEQCMEEKVTNSEDTCL